MEDKKLTGEDENLNSNSEADTGDNQEEAKTTFTMEEVEALKKKMQSDSDKGVQKILSEKRIYERVLDEVGKVADDRSYLVSLYEDSPEVAKVILGKYYDGQSIEEFKDSIGYEEDYTNPDIMKRKIELEAKRLTNEQTINAKKQEFIKKLEMGDDEIKTFEEAFEERKQLKSFNINDLETHFEKAYREVNDNPEMDKKLKAQETIAKTMATGEGKGGGGEKGKDKLQTEIGSFLDKYL